MEELQRAAACLAGGEDEQALEALLEAWRAFRAPAIAELIDAVSDRLTALREPLPKRKLWHRAARDGSAADVGRLVASFHATGWMGEHELDELYRRPDDPRIAGAMLAYLPGTGAAPHLRNMILRALRRTADPRGAEALRRYHVDQGRAIAEIERVADWIEAQAPGPLPAADAALVERMRGRLDEGRQTESSLLAAIHEAPDDDARRLVYADWLLDRGRPRGELIALQYRARERPLSAEERRRERALLRGHAVEWLGALAPALTRPYRFERGFLAEATLRGADPALLTKDRPEWATVRELHAFSHDERLAELIHSPGLRRLRGLHGVMGRFAEALAAGTPLALESMTLHLDGPYPAFSRSEAFPRLVELSARGPIEAFAWAFALPLRRIVLLFEREHLPGWLRRLGSAPQSLVEFGFSYVHGQELELVRAEGEWRLAETSLPPEILEQALAAAPPGLITGSGSPS